MIIILNGMLGTNIQNIAKQLSLILNNNETNEISNIYENLSFNESFQVNHKEDDTNPFHTIDKEIKDNTQVEEKIKRYYNAIEKYTQIEDLNTSLSNSYNFDLGFKNHPDFLESNKYDNEYFTNIYNNYNELKDSIHHYIICGQIGKYGITQLKEYFKNEEIKVFNIIMNPVLSECIFKNKYPDIRNRFFYYDVHNAITLKNERDVETIKFENILLNKGLILNKNLIKLFKIEDESKNIEINYKLIDFYSNTDFFQLWVDEDDINEFTTEYLKYNDKLPNLVKNCFRELHYKIQK